MSPDGFTLGELIDMAEAKERAEWFRTSELIAAVVNTVSKRPINGAQVDPYRSADARAIRTTPADLAARLRVPIGRVPLSGP